MIRLLTITAPDYDAELLARKVEQVRPEIEPDTGVPELSWFILPEWALYIILGVAFIFVVWFVVTRTRLLQMIVGHEEEELPEVEDEVNPDTDIRNHDYDGEIETALGGEDYVLAIHLLYLKGLSELNDKHRIRWATYKTPMMYIDELRVGRRHLTELTRLFLYTTYGHYPASRDMFDRADDVLRKLCSVEKGGEG